MLVLGVQEGDVSRSLTGKHTLRERDITKEGTLLSGKSSIQGTKRSRIPRKLLPQPPPRLEMIQVCVGRGMPSPALSLGLLVLVCARWAEPYRPPYPEEDQERYDPRDYRQTTDNHRDTSDRTRTECRRCCDPGEEPLQYRTSNPQYQVVPQINITILKGEKGDVGQRGGYGKAGKTGQTGQRGPNGIKGEKGSIGIPGEPCKSYYAAFSVGRKKALHSNDYYQTLVFDTELVNLYGHFNMFTGKFFCYVPGIYFFSLNVHTWNQKETYLHIMKNEQEMAILYAQPSDRSIMQSQSLMLELERDDEVWVRLYKGERENAVFSDDFDTYITFNGHLIKAKSEG